MAAGAGTQSQMRWCWLGLPHREAGHGFTAITASTWPAPDQIQQIPFKQPVGRLDPLEAGLQFFAVVIGWFARRRNSLVAPWHSTGNSNPPAARRRRSGRCKRGRPCRSGGNSRQADSLRFRRNEHPPSRGIQTGRRRVSGSATARCSRFRDSALRPQAGARRRRHSASRAAEIKDPATHSSKLIDRFGRPGCVCLRSSRGPAQCGGQAGWPGFIGPWGSCRAAPLPAERAASARSGQLAPPHHTDAAAHGPHPARLNMVFWQQAASHTPPFLAARAKLQVQARSPAFARKRPG